MKILEENMRKSLPYVSLLLFAVVVASSSASAQTQITLGNTVSPNIVTFTNVTTPTHELTVSFNCPATTSGTTCTVASGANSNLSIGGVASGANGAYSFTTTLGATGLPFLHDPLNGLFTYNANNSPTVFSISGIGASPGTVTMSINIQTVADGSSTPRFNGIYTVTGVTGGSTLAQFFPVNATNQFDFTVRTNGPDLLSLFNGANGGTASGPISSGEIVTPEPASIALFGSGLLLLGRVLRRRKTSAPAEPSEE